MLRFTIIWIMCGILNLSFATFKWQSYPENVELHDGGNGSLVWKFDTDEEITAFIIHKNPNNTVVVNFFVASNNWTAGEHYRGRVMFSYTNTSVSVTLIGIGPDDGGTYTCTALNGNTRSRNGTAIYIPNTGNTVNTTPETDDNNYAVSVGVPLIIITILGGLAVATYFLNRIFGCFKCGEYQQTNTN